MTSSGPTVEFKVHFRNGDRGRKRLRPGARPAPPQVDGGRIPRVSKLMALAIRFETLIRQGAVRDYADLARLGGVTRARLSQIMDLLQLAPDIQEELLFLPRTAAGRDPVTERNLRPVTCEPDWSRQRAAADRILVRSRPEQEPPTGGNPC
jgi:hypothetical protein